VVYKIISLWPDVFLPFTQPFSTTYITATNYQRLSTQQVNKLHYKITNGYYCVIKIFYCVICSCKQ